MPRGGRGRKPKTAGLGSHLATIERPTPQVSRRRKNRNRAQRRRGQSQNVKEDSEVDEDGDIDAVSQSVEEALADVQLSDSEEPAKHQQQQRCNPLLEAMKPSRNKKPDKRATSHFDVQKLCSAVGDMYVRMREYAVELGVAKDSEDDMDWQPEPTTPVYLVRMTDEVSCYPDGTVLRPWEGMPTTQA
ncbi:hypothetical protein FZEAL_2289 [Fusarium zealandicum]|uniref:Uncharacterized protein n=1 Tax=Fusarium zealandicum TaxID=1053134 RepID=A0A8H4XNM1_9HYPO|nr:hypothetical protein FZEAL_2289 [Fusarium zealandicum]